EHQLPSLPRDNRGDASNHSPTTRRIATYRRPGGGDANLSHRRPVSCPASLVSCSLPAACLCWHSLVYSSFIPPHLSPRTWSCLMQPLRVVAFALMASLAVANVSHATKFSVLLGSAEEPACVVSNPLYQSSGTSGDNPLFEGRALILDPAELWQGAPATL